MFKRLLRLFVGSCLILLAVEATHDLGDRLVKTNIVAPYSTIIELQAVISKILLNGSPNDCCILDFQRAVAQTKPLKQGSTFPKVQVSLKYCFFRHQIDALLAQLDCITELDTVFKLTSAPNTDVIPECTISPELRRHLFKLTANAPPCG